MAEAIFNHKIKEAGLNNHFEGDSCGTSNYHIGDSPDRRTIKNVQKNGVYMSHAARQLSENDLERFDMILAMDESNYQNILRLSNARLHLNKIKMMREFDPLGSGDVPDPYFGGDDGFQEVFEMLDRSIDQLITKNLVREI